MESVVVSLAVSQGRRMPLFPRQPLDPSSLDRTPEHQDQHRAPGAVPDAEPHIPRDCIQIHLEMEKEDPKTGWSQAFMNPRREAAGQAQSWRLSILAALSGAELGSFPSRLPEASPTFSPFSPAQKAPH